MGTSTGYYVIHLYGQGPSEMQATNGMTGQFVPLIYTVGPTIMAEKLDPQGGNVVAVVLDSPKPIRAAVNAARRIGYSFELNHGPAGPRRYRLRFRWSGRSTGRRPFLACS